MTIELREDRLKSFANALRATGRSRLSLSVVWTAFNSAFPARPPGADRAWLAHALNTLASEGAIQLPPSRSARWDRAVSPALPVVITVVRDHAPAAPPTWKSFPWCAPLAWVSDMARLNSEQEAFLRRVHEGFVQGHFSERTPLKHRSLQLTRGEKRLEVLLRSSLFHNGRLTIEMLGAYRETTPIAWESVGDGESVLVFENAGPFTVARTVMDEMTDPPYGMVAYGGGAAFTQSVSHLASVGRKISAIHYVGDIDLPGLRYARGGRVQAQLAGLPVPIAAPGMHAAMLSCAGDLAHPDGWAYEDIEIGEGRISDVEFLPSDVREQAARVLRAGRRIPEEVLGPREMREVLGALSRQP